MVNSTIVLAIIGVALYLFLFINIQKLLKNNQAAMIHLILAGICTLWLPIPIVFALKHLEYDMLIVGAIFGTLSLLLEIIVMIVQASHLSYAVEHLKEKDYFEKVNSWVLNGLIGSQVELFFGLLKFIWVVFVTVYFFQTNQYLYMVISMVFLLMDMIYIPMIISDNLNKKSKFKLNQIMIHLDMLL